VAGCCQIQFNRYSQEAGVMQFKLKCLALAMVALGLAPQAHAEIRFGFAAEPFPPFLFKDANGKWAGWEADLMAAICTDLNERCVNVDVAWSDLIPALQAKQFDVIWSSMAITPKRQEVIAFTSAYYNTRVEMMGARTGDKDISPTHLSGKKIGVQVGTIHEDYGLKYFVHAGASLKTYDTQNAAHQDLAAGRLDYVQGAAPVISAFLATDMGKDCCELKGEVPWDSDIFGQGVAGGLRKGDVALKAKLDGAIADLVKAGTFAKITRKYPGLATMITTPTP
jgi:polar amino acid transport system substrate-binding protein